MNTERKSKTEALKADIVVMGSGGGLAAAVAAAELGIKDIIVLEKEDALGGYTSQAMGLMACESSVQKRQNIIVSRDEIFRRYTRWSHWHRIDPRVVRAYINKTGDTIGWLEAKGVEFGEAKVPPSDHPNQLPIGHHPIGGGAAIQEALISECRKLGVKLILNTSGKRILRGAKDNITGVVAFKEGEEYRITAKSVIIATGGFGNNRELLKKYCPDYYDDMPLDPWPHHSAHTGDGLLMAEEIGAAIADSIPIYHYGPFYPGSSNQWQGIPTLVTNPGTVWVNKKGKRFINEACAGHMVCGNAIIAQPDRVTYNLSDDEIRRNVEKGSGSPEGTPGSGSPGLIEELTKHARRGEVKISDSWEEIARWIGTDADALKAEIDEYNRYCDQGHDEIFVKDRKYLRPLQRPPYYAVRFCARAGETLGGIKVNEHMEVLDGQGNIIQGVYAAGVIADGFQGQTYCYDLPGTAMGFAVNSGRIAGESAASFVLEKPWE